MGILSEISSEITIPIVQPYNKLILNKETFYDSYIKIDNNYIDFIDGLGLSYSECMSTTTNNRPEKHNDKPVIAVLSEIVREFLMDIDYVKEAMSTILDLFILGRLHHKNTTPVEKLTISRRVIFPVFIYIKCIGCKISC